MSFMKVRMGGAWSSRAPIVRAIVALAFAGLFAAACEDSTGPETLTTLTITPATATVGPGGTVQFTAAGTRSGSDVTDIVGETWSVTGGGTISSSGLFTAPTTPGTSTVTVTCGGISTVVTITITAGPLATITVTPNPTLAIGATQQFTAVGRDAFNNVVAITPVWTTTNPPGTINASTGLFTAGNTLGTFNASVRATSGAIFGTANVTVIAGPVATITVTPNPATLLTGAQQQFTAVGRDAGGNVIAITPVWSVTSGGGTINASTGLFTAGNTAGTFTNTVRATSGTIFGTATVIVTAPAPAPLATITVTPNPATLLTGAQQQFTAVGRDADGNVIAITPVWSVTNGGGTIDPSTGLFTAGNTTGTFNNTVRATSGGISGTATVIVTAPAPAALATITVTPNPATLLTGAQQQFTAVGRDAGGNVIAITPVWSVTNGGGTIDASTGLFTAGNTTGTFNNTVRATSGTIFGTATVIVTAPAPAALATITVTPNPATLLTGAQQQFTAVGRDAGGNVIAITPVWSVTNGGGTIDASTGLFTAGITTGTFTNTVRATSGTIFGTATVIVTAPPAPAAGFRMIARVAWTCTNGSITGDIGTNQTASEVPPGAITQSLCPITGGTPQLGTTAAKQAYQDFLIAYAAREAIPCGTVLTGTLAGQTLAPGVYCFDNAATLTGTLTLSGPSTGQWLFKVGTAGTGALTGTNFSVVMAGGASACNLEWWVRQSSSMTTSNFKGHILAGAGISFTGGTYKGNAYSKEDVTVTGAAITACDAP